MVQGRVQLDVIFVLGRLKYVNEIAAVEFPIQIRVAKPDSYTQNATLDMLEKKKGTQLDSDFYYPESSCVPIVFGRQKMWHAAKHEGVVLLRAADGSYSTFFTLVTSTRGGRLASGPDHKFARRWLLAY